MSPRLLRFLLVEDDPDHAELVMRGLSRNRVSNEVAHVRDGAAALAYLRGEEEYADRPRPDVVLLDLNLPKLSGHEVLRSIKSDAGLQALPVVVLTTSDAERDRIKAYEEHVNSYVVKPLDFDQFHRLIGDLGLYWGIWNQPPV